jgi:hypothetical protein
MSDQNQIEQTIQTYFDCMLESSAEKVHEAFHANAKITGYIEDSLREMTVTDFANLVAAQQPSPKEKGETLPADILSIEIAGDTAVARVRDDYIGKTFLDTLSFIKDGGTWSIYNKLFHVEGPTG